MHNLSPVRVAETKEHQHPVLFEKFLTILLKL